jgi:hypothetical protein
MTDQHNDRLILAGAGPATFAALADVPLAACAVTAFRGEHRAGGLAIRYSVVSGDAVFEANGARQIEGRTDQAGHAAVDLRLRSRGRALIAAELADDPEQRVFFTGLTEGVTATITLLTDPPAAGAVSARAVAVDHLGEPVTGANLIAQIARGRGIVVAGSVAEDRAGAYAIKVAATDAAEWSLVVQDSDTRVTARACVSTLPGPPASFRLVGDLDPRSSRPYDRVTLRARLEDAQGNALSPARIVAPGAVVVGDEARFTVRAAGRVRLSDAESDVALDVDVRYSPFWLSSPGPVFVGDQFATELYARPGTVVEIALDSELVAYKGFEPAAGVKATATHDKRGRVTIKLAGRAGEPVCVGKLRWQCQGEGRTCFALTAGATRAGEPWTLCVDQKLRNRRSLCLNFIYDKANEEAALKAATAVITSVETIISGAENVKRCCPVLVISAHYETIGDILIKEAVGADGAVTTYKDEKADYQKLFKALAGMPNSVLKADCLNIVLISINDGSSLGLTDIGGNRSVIDPTQAVIDAELGAHEVAHALGLLDVKDATRLMHESSPSGRELTAEECRTIQRNLARLDGE